MKAADQASVTIEAQYATVSTLGKGSGYGLFNGRIAYQLEYRNIEIMVYGRNIANKKYIHGASPVGYPGTYGVEVSYQF